MSTDDDRAAKQDIAEVLVRYATSIDRRDWTSFRTCFTDRCDVEYEGAGSWRDVEAITEFMTAVHAGMGHTLHRVSNIDTVVDGPNARARSYVDAVLMASDGLTGINTIGWYDDELVLAEDRWEIARRRFTMSACSCWARTATLRGDGRVVRGVSAGSTFAATVFRWARRGRRGSPPVNRGT